MPEERMERIVIEISSDLPFILSFETFRQFCIQLAMSGSFESLTFMLGTKSMQRVLLVMSCAYFLI
jgi:hypothetical protein